MYKIFKSNQLLAFSKANKNNSIKTILMLLSFIYNCSNAQILLPKPQKKSVNAVWLKIMSGILPITQKLPKNYNLNSIRLLGILIDERLDK